MSCGEISMLDGGTIRNSTIINSQIANPIIQGGNIDGSSISNLATIDAASAQRIADAIANLTPEQLAGLINALSQKQSIIPAAAPTTSESHAVPTEMHGDREIGMGAPDMWAQYGDDYVLPLYERR